jgi:hypothetical protein
VQRWLFICITSVFIAKTTSRLIMGFYYCIVQRLRINPPPINLRKLALKQSVIPQFLPGTKDDIEVISSTLKGGQDNEKTYEEVRDSHDGSRFCGSGRA